MKQFLCGGFALAAFIAGPAMAADMPVKAPVYKAPPPAVVYNWTGFYAGLNGGYGWGHTSALVSRGDPTTLFVLFGVPQSGRPDFNLSGAVFGGQAGYNYQINPTWLVGIETDLQWSGIKGSGSGAINSVFSDPFFGLPPFAIAADARLKWFGTLRGRVGYLPTDHLLVYVTGGLAYGRVDASVNVSQTYPGTTSASAPGLTVTCVFGTPCYSGQDSRTSLGGTVGVGFEYRLWNNVSLKTEYLYMRLYGPNFFVPATNSVPPGAGGLYARYDRADFNIVRVGLNWRFDWAGPVRAAY